MDILNNCKFISFINLSFVLKMEEHQNGEGGMENQEEASYEFLAREHEDYEVQTKDYFKTTKKLNNKGLNPRLVVPSHIVSNAYIAKSFWTIH